MKVGKALGTMGLGLVGGFVAFFALDSFKKVPEQASAKMEVVSPVGTRQVVYDPDRPSAPGLPGTVDLREAAKMTVPAVVHVTTTQKGRVYRNPFLEFFYGVPEVQQPTRTGIGSGVIISPDGYIITNNHVIEKSDAIKVTLDNKKEYEARIVGTDPGTDIALIKIEASGLPYLTYADSDDVELGEWVLAVGNPYNLTSTVTAGIISAKARQLGINNEQMSIESFLQTDAAVNSGNSGGALVNAHGELIGINTAIGSPTGNYSGYAFAVPSNIAQKVVNDLMAFGTVQRAMVGIRMIELTADVSKELNLNEIGGIYVSEVLAGGPAQKAGLQSGDIIKFVNGITVNTLPAFQGQLGKYNPGTTVEMRVLRDGKLKDFQVTLEDMGAMDTASILGATLKPLSRAERNRYRINGGIRIEKIQDGPLKNAGLQEGHIIVKINNDVIQGMDDFNQAIKQAENEGVLITAISPRGRIEYFAFSLQN